MDITFVVPVYNTKLIALRKCFSSIRKSFDGIELQCEIIMIDDGSKKEFSMEYKQLADEKDINYIRIDHNMGVSNARNVGIEHASGKYIMFVDSDDELLSFDKGIINLIKQDNNVVIFDYYVNDSLVSLLGIKTGNVLSRELLYKFILSDNLHTPVSKLYKKSFLLSNQILFSKEMISGEDALFNINVLEASKYCFYTRQVLYRYNHNIHTQDDRFFRKPDKMLSNTIYLLAEKKKVVDSFGDDCSMTEGYYEYYTTQLFRCYCYFLLLRLNGLAARLRKYISDDLAYKNVRLGVASRIKRVILLHNIPGMSCIIIKLFGIKHSYRKEHL